MNLLSALLCACLLLSVGAEGSSPPNAQSVPDTHIKLGESLDPQNIREGHDVYFECLIQAYPRAHTVIWTHNGRQLNFNVRAGVIMSNQSLVLQRLTRDHSGNYSCTASNTVGDGASTPITLDVKYAPVCVHGQTQTYDVGRDEDVELPCRVAANPPADTFRWTFNHTADITDVSSGRITNTPNHSNLSYTPRTELDYGTLFCWAGNRVGRQMSPCVFHIIPSGKPDPPGNCSVINRTATSLSVDCQAGFDGGLKQIFLLRVAQPGLQGYNMSAETPLFQVNELLPDTIYRLQVWAANDKGVSPSVDLQAFTTHPPTREDPAFPGCPKPFVNVMSECFVLSLMELTWSESRHLCRWMGGDLATPKNLIAVREYFMQESFTGQGGIWVGATDEDDPGVWNWVNGQPIEDDLWGPVEPDGGNHHCLSVSMTTTWYPPLYDHPCSTPRRPLCQYHH